MPNHSKRQKDNESNSKKNPKFALFFEPGLGVGARATQKSTPLLGLISTCKFIRLNRKCNSETWCRNNDDYVRNVVNRPTRLLQSIIHSIVRYFCGNDMIFFGSFPVLGDNLKRKIYEGSFLSVGRAPAVMAAPTTT